MIYLDLENPYAPRLVAKSIEGKWAYAVGDQGGVEYCVVTQKEWDDPQRIIPAGLGVVPTASLFKFNPLGWNVA